MPEQHIEMVPPWEEFPTYERYTIGWRMGTGEDYRYNWYKFIEKLSNDYNTRLNYLRCHRPAPLNWGDEVLAVLFPKTESEQEYGCSQAEILKLLNMGLVEHDAAYQTWINKQSAIIWPWLLRNTPPEATLYRTREFWFFSRQLNAARGLGDVEFDTVPGSWQSVETQLLTGHLGNVDPTQGLLTLAQMLCAGSVKPPWTLGISPDDFTDSFEMDMGYSNAFRLWLRSAFDDDILLREMLQKTQIPSEWVDWVDENADFC
jgi:hypothetical protein